MSEKSKIQWTDSTANFWEGCTKVSDGCKNCYAEARDKRFTGGKLWGKGASRRKSKSAVKDCLAWNKKPWICDECGEAYGATLEQGHLEQCWHDGESNAHRRRVFSLSLGDWLDPEVPIEWLAEMLDTIRRCDQLQFILCTKRPELWAERILSVMRWIEDSRETTQMTLTWKWILDWRVGDKIPENIILLTSVENNSVLKRIDDLLEIPAVCHGISAEPLLEKLKLNPVNLPLLKWIIAGGESGHNARPCNVEWIECLAKQGQSAGCAIFVKQLGAYSRTDNANTLDLNEDVELIGDGDGFAAGRIMWRDKKGGDISEWPIDLQIQKFPQL